VRTEILLTGKFRQDGKGNGGRNGPGRKCPKYYCGNDAYKSKRRIEIITGCQLPLTGVKCVKKVVTDLAVLDITSNGFKLLERAPVLLLMKLDLKLRVN
jgi:Acyl CoA:acetate/3-ketoacid CoA transferase, beta subunit